MRSAGLTGDRRQLADLEQAQTTAARAEEIARTRYRGGLVTLSDVLQAQQRRLSLEEQVIETRGALARDTVALVKALGGGWPGSSAMNRARPIIVVILLIAVAALAWYLLRGSDRRAAAVGLYRGRKPVSRRAGCRDGELDHRRGGSAGGGRRAAVHDRARHPLGPGRAGPSAGHRGPDPDRRRLKPMPSRPRRKRRPPVPTPTALAATSIACSRSVARIRPRWPARTSTPRRRPCAKPMPV